MSIQTLRHRCSAPERQHRRDYSSPHSSLPRKPRHLGTFDARRNRRAKQLDTLHDWTSLALVVAFLLIIALGF